MNQNIQNILFFTKWFLLGALIFTCTTTIQKCLVFGLPDLIYDYRGYVIPTIFGGLSGILLGLYSHALQKEKKLLLERVNRLDGILPICSYCKKIRNDKENWDQLEEYVEDHSKAKFSHSICPDCINENHKDILDRTE